MIMMIFEIKENCDTKVKDIQILEHRQLTDMPFITSMKTLQDLEGYTKQDLGMI